MLAMKPKMQSATSSWLESVPEACVAFFSKRLAALNVVNCVRSNMPVCAKSRRQNKANHAQNHRPKVARVDDVCVGFCPVGFHLVADCQPHEELHRRAAANHKYCRRAYPDALDRSDGAEAAGDPCSSPNHRPDVEELSWLVTQQIKDNE